MIQNLKRDWLVVSKLTWGIWQIVTQALKSVKSLHFNGCLLTKVYKATEELCVKALEIDAKFEGKLICHSKMTWVIWQIFTGWKMAELNQNQNSKLLDRLDTVRKLYLGNKWIVQLTKIFTHVLQNCCSWGIRKFPRKLWK